MQKLLELIALVLIRKGVDAAIAWALAQEIASEYQAEGMGGGGCCGTDPLAECRMRGRADLEDECFAWDLPRSRRH